MGEKREDIVVVVSHGMVLEVFVVVVVVPEFDKDSRNSQRAMSLFSARVESPSRRYRSHCYNEVERSVLFFSVSNHLVDHSLNLAENFSFFSQAGRLSS